MFAEETETHRGWSVDTALFQRSQIDSTSEKLCETHPRFRQPELNEFVLLHYCRNKDICIDMLSYWANTRDGERAKTKMAQIFQSSLAPEELALMLSVMALLWRLSPFHFQSPPASLSSLNQLLSSPNTI